MARFEGNRFTDEFGLQVPIVQGPVGGVACPELVAAVANAGALGILPVWTLPPEQVEREVQAIQQLTDRRFGVNLRADLVQIDQIYAAISAGASIIHLFWGDPTASMGPILHSAGVKMIATVGDSEAARIALDAGASALVAQGIEAGGHVLGHTPLKDLLEMIVELAGEVPVIAAGGLADAEDVAEVLRLGASAALLGTRFVATLESVAHDDYKQALCEAGADSTVRSECFELGWANAPHRHLKNTTFRIWDQAGRPPAGARPGEGEVVLRMGDIEIPRYAAMPPRREMAGDIRAAVLYAGQGVEKIVDCPKASEVVRELASGLGSR